MNAPDGGLSPGTLTTVRPGIRPSLRTRIVLLALLAVLVPAIAMIIYALKGRGDDMRDAKKNLTVAARNAGNELESRVNGTTQLLFGLSQSRELETPDRDACSAYLAEVLKRYPQYTGILTIKPNGELHCDSLRSGRALNVADRAYFQQALTSTEPAYELVFGRLTGIGVLQVALAARDAQGKVTSVLLASLDLMLFSRQVAEAQPYPQSVVTIFDRTGTMIAGYAGPNIPSRAGTNFRGSDLFRFAQSGQPGDTADVTGVRGNRRIWALGGLPERDAGLMLLLGVPVANLSAAAEARMLTTLGVIAFSSLLALFAALSLSYSSIRNPLLRIMGRIEKLRQGDLQSRIGEPYPRGEIGEVMLAFDRTADELQVQQGVILRHAEEQQRAQAVLRRSEMHFRAIFDNVAVGILRASPDGTLLQVNQRLCDMLGYVPDELASRSILDLTYAQDVDAVRAYMERLVAGDRNLAPLQNRFVHKSGSTLWMEYAATLAFDPEGKPEYVLGVVADLSARKRAEAEAQTLREELEDRVVRRTAELAAANKRLESFSYSVSHDLRTPLRAISGFSQILARRHAAALNEEGRHYLSNIVRASALMGRLIEDLLTYSRLGRKTVKLVAVPLTEIISDVVRQLQPRLTERGGELQVPADLPMVRGDVTLLTQIVLNLLDNALTYCRPGTPPRVELSWHSADNGDVILCVTDNGIGIDPSHFEKIFGVFQRLHGQEEYPGTGIGLATVKQALDMLEGKIWVESSVGNGSSFFVQLPRASGLVDSSPRPGDVAPIA